MEMRNILIVDDNRAFAENLAEIVGDAGVGAAKVADSAKRALELVAASRFDALVTDMRMPNMSGAELIDRARQIRPGASGHRHQRLFRRRAADDGRASGRALGLTEAGADRALARANRAGAARWSRGGRRDDIALADNVAEALRERGFASVIAHTLQETDRLRGTLCAALVDLRLPGGDDGAALARIVARFPDVPLLVVTGFRGEIAVPADIEIVDKPFDTARLLTPSSIWPPAHDIDNHTHCDQ